MDIRRNIYIKPLAAAMAIALGAGSATVSADTAPHSTFATQMSVLRQAVAQLRQQYAQHPQALRLFPAAAQRVPVHFAKRHKNTPAALATPSATISVTSCLDNASSATTAGTLRYAVLNAVNGDVIDLSACNASTITLTQGALPVAADDLYITAGSGNRVTIDGNAADRVFYVTGPGTGSSNVLGLAHLTIRNGKAPLMSSGSPPVGIAVGGCIAALRNGVGLYDSVVTGCQATSANGAAEGGGLIAYGGLYMQGSTISNNTASAQKTGSGTSKYGAIGAGAIAGGLSYIYNSHIDGNAITVSNGASFADAGGIVAFSPTIVGSTISNNSVNLSAGNTSAKYLASGGGLAAKYGGNVSTSTISGNTVTCTTTNTTPNAFCLAGGLLSGYGPGSGTGSPVLTVSDSTISGNHSDLIGGGVFSKYPLALQQSTISGNSATGGGGMVQKYVSGATVTGMTVSNSTIAANTSEYAGAGIYDLPYSYGGGGPAVPAPITLVSSIVAKNTNAGVPDDIFVKSGYALTIAGSNSLVMAATSNVTLPADTLAGDPLLQALANNGGPTRTMGLSVGSPALETGSNPNAFANDQRGAGFPRVVGALPDIGAFEGIAVPASAAVPAPALSLWAMGLLATLLGFLGWRRRHSG